MAKRTEPLRHELSDRQAAVADALLTTGAFQFGEFYITAHKVRPGLPPSPIFIDVEKLQSDAQASQTVLDEYQGLLEEMRPQLLIPVPNGANGWAQALSERLGIPAVMGAKQKQDGLAHYSVEEIPLEHRNKPAIIIEDVISTGTSTIQTIEAAIRAKGSVSGAVAIIDRLAGGKTTLLQQYGIPCNISMTIHQLLDYYTDKGIVSRVQADSIRQTLTLLTT